MKCIYKFSLSPALLAGLPIFMPRGAKPLHVHTQDSQVFVWAEVDVDQDPVRRRIVLIPTGGEVPEGTYIGTIGPDDYRFVFHVYDLGETT